MTFEYPSYFKQVWNRYGWKSIYKQFRYTVRRPYSRSLIQRYAADGKGLEIGVGRQSIAPLKRTLLSDAFDDHAHFPSIAHAHFKSEKIPYANESFSFIISEHTLEHLSNPILNLIEWKRVLKKEGSLFLFLPHKERIFDFERPRTTLTHLIDDYEKKVPDNDQTHLSEFIDKVIQPGRAPQYSQIPPLELASSGCLHHHVWITEDIQELLEYLAFKILYKEDRVPDRPDSFVVIAKKV